MRKEVALACFKIDRIITCMGLRKPQNFSAETDNLQAETRTKNLRNRIKAAKYWTVNFSGTKYVDKNAQTRF